MKEEKKKEAENKIEERNHTIRRGDKKNSKWYLRKNERKKKKNRGIEQTKKELPETNPMRNCKN